MLEGKGALLDTARDVSRLLGMAEPGAAVVGGVAVVLHGYVRTTSDVDLYVPGAAERVAEILQANGFPFDPDRREFVRDGVPVHLVRPEQIPTPPRTLVEIEGIRTVSLADLLNIKLRSGLKHRLRAIDLADVIGLIRRHGLTGAFTRQIDKDLRPEFRKLARDIQREG